MRVRASSWGRLIVADRGRCACCRVAGLRSCALPSTATPPRPPSSRGLARTSTRRTWWMRVRDLSFLSTHRCSPRALLCAEWRDCAHARCSQRPHRHGRRARAAWRGHQREGQSADALRCARAWVVGDAAWLAFMVAVHGCRGLGARSPAVVLLMVRDAQNGDGALEIAELTEPCRP